MDKLLAHEAVCEERYKGIVEKLEAMDKRMWRLEGLTMVSTIAVVGAAVTVVTLIV
jgi:hypothetical protein|tara:strand:+ start:208 stop:375 length:168 start_codon:yes stop_codon:yes gene_type:complete